MCIALKQCKSSLPIRMNYFSIICVQFNMQEFLMWNSSLLTHTPLHIGVEYEVWLFCTNSALIPRMPRVMLDTPSPISTTERTSKLQTSARLVHMLLWESFLRLGENVKCKDSLSHLSKKCV